MGCEGEGRVHGGAGGAEVRDGGGEHRWEGLPSI